MISLYIHIPFCKCKCKYCSFYSVTDKKDEYFSALKKSIEWHSKWVKDKLYTLYIGGGTPSLMTKRELCELMSCVYENFDTSALCETTLEANPESVTEDFLRYARTLGVDRLSLGIQSFDDKELSTIGRLHTSYEAKKAIESAKDAGFENISCDLIFGLPEQSAKSLLKSVQTLIDCDVTHISCYNLQIEEGTELYKRKTPVPNEEIQRQMYFEMCNRLKDNGFEHYEISNFAKKGFESRHNSVYWKDADYLGIGPSAHSKLSGKRCGYNNDVEAFCKKTDFEFDFCEKIDDELFEKIMLSLRTANGLDLSLVPKSRQYIDMLCKNGFANIKDGFVRLTDEGFYLSNTIISDITAKEC